jgi:hypothetical protein
MSKKPQKCSKCKQDGHNARNCPCPIVFDDPPPIDVESILINQETYTERERSNKLETMKCLEETVLIQLIKKGLRKESEPYLFENVKHTVVKIMENIFSGKLATLIVAEPGSGKTLVMDGVAYMSKTHPIPLMGDRITVMTGMSDTLCRDSLNESLPFVREYVKTGEIDNGPSECVYHNPMIPKRFKFLKEHPHYLYMHIFIDDESHVACNIGNIIDLQLKLLGITREVAKKLKIHFVLISATPDAILKEYRASYEEDYDVVFMKSGENYRGFKFFNNRILDYKSLDIKQNRETIISMIKEKYTDPMYHFIRIKPGKFHIKLQLELEEEGWNVEHYNMNSKKFIALDSIIKKKPESHTFFFVVDMLRASKRLRLNEFIGVIIEPYNITNVTITAQGLIPRWWGYYTNSEISITDPMFICNYSAVKEYLKFIENEGYVGDGYRSRNMNKREFKSHQSNILDRDPAKDNLSKINRSDYYRIYDDENIIKKVCDELDYTYIPVKNNPLGFKETSLNKTKAVVSLTEAISKVDSGYGGGGATRTFYPCYLDITDAESLVFVLLVRKNDVSKVKEKIDHMFPPIQI